MLAALGFPTSDTATTTEVITSAAVGTPSSDTATITESSLIGFPGSDSATVTAPALATLGFPTSDTVSTTEVITSASVGNPSSDTATVTEAALLRFPSSDAGAVLEATEDMDVLLETLDLQRCMMIPLASASVGSRLQEWHAESNRQRYEHIATNIQIGFWNRCFSGRRLD